MLVTMELSTCPHLTEVKTEALRDGVAFLGLSLAAGGLPWACSCPHGILPRPPAQGGHTAPSRTEDRGLQPAGCLAEGGTGDTQVSLAAVTPLWCRPATDEA